MNERVIQQQLKSIFGNYDYKLFNVFVYGWESDFFCISKSKYALEVEIKCSRADFKKDFTKTDKHKILENHKLAVYTQQPSFSSNEFSDRPIKVDGVFYKPTYCHVNYVVPANLLPNKFYYCVPENLISVDECPSYAGLFYIKTHTHEFPGKESTFTYSLEEVKRAPFLHKQINNLDRALLSKYYFKHIDLKNSVRTFLYDIDHLIKEEGYHRDAMRQLLKKLL